MKVSLIDPPVLTSALRACGQDPDVGSDVSACISMHMAKYERVLTHEVFFQHTSSCLAEHHLSDCSDKSFDPCDLDTVALWLQLDEIHRLATLLCLSSVDPGEIAVVVQEELEKSGRDSPGITMTGNEIAYRRPILPGEATERIEQAFGVWMTMHGYPVKNHSGREGLSGTSELLSGNVLRVQNCPRRPERDAV
jgi:hypothetical protein